MLSALHIRRSVVTEMETAEIAIGIITVVLEILRVEKETDRDTDRAHTRHTKAQGSGPKYWWLVQIPGSARSSAQSPKLQFQNRYKDSICIYI